MLSNRELATLINELQVPLIVSDILANEDELEGDVQYALHEIISDMQPDSALLCIALAAKHIARIYHQASPSTRIMDLECERIINDYAPLWLENAKNGNAVESQIALDALMHVPEDLEGLAEMLDLNISFLHAKDETAAALCEVLQIQAEAQAMIAEELFGAINLDMRKERHVYMPTVAPEIADVAMNENVIPFPMHKTRA